MAGRGSGRRAVFCSTYSWNTTVRVSAHHLSRALARRGWQVLFLSTPVSPWHALARRGDPVIRQKLASWWGGGRDDDGITAYTPLTLLPHTYQRPFDKALAFEQWHRWTLPGLGRKLAALGGAEPDLLVIDNVLMQPLIELLRPGKTVYRITDYYPGLATTTAVMNAAERALAPRVDLVAYTAQHLRAHAESLQPRAHACVPHGVDIDLFETPVPAPPEYAAIPAPRALYVGLLSAWFDTALVNLMAERLPQVSFVIIGPPHAAPGRFAIRPNLHLLGARPYEQVAAYMQHAQIGLLPFARARMPEVVDNINPLKLYQYLLAGLPVVSTAWRELERQGAPVVACAGPEEFAPAITRVLAGEAPDTALGRDFARQADWLQRADQLLAAVGLEPSS